MSRAEVETMVDAIGRRYERQSKAVNDVKNNKIEEDVKEINIADLAKVGPAGLQKFLEQ